MGQESILMIGSGMSQESTYLDRWFRYESWISLVRWLGQESGIHFGGWFRYESWINLYGWFRHELCIIRMDDLGMRHGSTWLDGSGMSHGSI
jgi:hypothetical protein